MKQQLSENLQILKENVPNQELQELITLFLTKQRTSMQLESFLWEKGLAARYSEDYREELIYHSTFRIHNYLTYGRGDYFQDEDFTYDEGREYTRHQLQILQIELTSQDFYIPELYNDQELEDQ